MKNTIVVYRSDGVAVEIPFNPDQIETDEFKASLVEAVVRALTIELLPPKQDAA